MISAPEFWLRYREDEVTRQQVRPGTARRVWPYLRRYRGPMVLLVFITAVGSAVFVVSTLILRLIIDDGILRHRESVVITLALTVAGAGSGGRGRGIREAGCTQGCTRHSSRRRQRYGRPSWRKSSSPARTRELRYHHLQRLRRNHLAQLRSDLSRRGAYHADLARLALNTGLV
jgi:ABC-type multidrug transport system fused ATPase/permease subunit